MVCGANLLFLFMRYLLLRGFLLILLCGGSTFFLHAQKKKKSPVASNNTSYTESVKAPKSSKKIYTIYKTDLKGTLPGNKCVEDLSKKMGFRYEQVMKNGPGSMSQEGIFFHNLGAKTILFFRNGPFWQARFKKKRKECQKKTGDYVG